MSEQHNPLEQFKIHYLSDFAPVYGLNLNFSNSSLFMVIAGVLISVFMFSSIRSRAMVPGRWQSMSEVMYQFVAKVITDVTGEAGLKYFPFIFTLFMFILFSNLLGLMPYSFTTTSHIAVTFALALVIFIGVTIIGFVQHGLHFFSLFCPKGTPTVIAPVLILIEIFAYFIRPVSLSVRLAANMLAGHTMLKVFAGFVVSMGFFGVVPLSFMVALNGFEIFVALLQAYVFTILTCVYLNDAIHLH
jgi:F-type H+-transporting ATPase subunit a